MHTYACIIDMIFLLHVHIYMYIYSNRLEGTMFDPAAGEGSSARAVLELEAHPSATGLHQVVEL